MKSYISGAYFATPDLGYRWCVMEQTPMEDIEGFSVHPIEFFFTEEEAVARCAELTAAAQAE
jgi:hypothetical protein